MAVSIEISSIVQNSQSIANNTSNITVTLIAKWTGGSWNHQPNQVYGWLKIDGTSYDFTVDKLNPNKTTSGQQTVLTKTVNVAHGSDGKKTVNCSASMATGLSSGTVTASAYKVLDTIYSTSDPSVSTASADMGTSITVYTNRESTSLTHDLAYSFAGSSYTTFATGVGNSYNWTIPDLASQIPNAVSGTLTIRCITKSGSTSVGTKYLTMTIKVPASVVPTISTVAVAEATAGLAARFGAYIRYKSKAKVTITAAGAKGSTIKSYSTTLMGSSYSGATFTTDELQNNGTLTFETTVTDTRGRKATKSTNITVLDYTPPVINFLRVYRVNAAGETDQDGVYIAVSYKYSVSSMNSKNTASMVLEYKQSTATEWTQLLSGTALSADTTTKPASPTFSTDYQYDFRIRVTDWFDSSGVYTAVLSSGAVILDISADGLGLGLFKVSDREGVDFGASAKGAVLGLWEATAEVPSGGDLNEYTKPGVYALPNNAMTGSVSNIPVQMAGTLRVWSALGAMKIEGAYAYITQEYHCYDPSIPTYRRLLVSDNTQAFTARPWVAVSKLAPKVLWQDAVYMQSGQTANLSGAISEQENGIVLVFSRYANGAPLDESFNSFFIHKKEVELLPGYGRVFELKSNKFGTLATKYLYINDTSIVGHADNNATGTGASGVTYTNNAFVMRYVLGV